MCYKFMLTISLILLLSVFSTSATAFESNITLRVNGHDHKMPDIISEEVQRQYLINKPIFEDRLRSKVIDGELL